LIIKKFNNLKLIKVLGKEFLDILIVNIEKLNKIKNYIKMLFKNKINNISINFLYLINLSLYNNIKMQSNKN
jgi:hypothetical protein